MLLSAKSETKLPLQALAQLSGRGLHAVLGAQLETTAWPPVHTHRDAAGLQAPVLLRRARRPKGRGARRAGAEPGFPARTASVLPTASPRGSPEDASVSLASRRGCRPGGAESAKTPRRGRNGTERCSSQARGRRLLTGTRSPRDPVSTESRAGDRVTQDRSSLDGPPSPKRRWASRGRAGLGPSAHPSATSVA